MGSWPIKQRIGNRGKLPEAGTSAARSSCGTFAQAQRAMAAAIMRPMTRRQGMQRTWIDGRSMYDVAAELIKPNDRLTSFERLEIYNRQYWFRLADSFYEDFPGLRLVLGQKKFDILLTEYLSRHPSSSFTLRNLGNRLTNFIEEEPQLTSPHQKLCRQMADCEWAKVVAFDGESKPPLTPGSLSGVDPARLQLRLQPYISLLELDYALDEFLIGLKRAERMHTEAGSMRAQRPGRQGMKVPKEEKVYLAVHRFDDSVYFKRLDKAAFALLSAIKSGAGVEEACAQIVATTYGADCSDLISNVTGWFRTWSELSWLYSID